MKRKAESNGSDDDERLKKSKHPVKTNNLTTTSSPAPNQVEPARPILPPTSPIPEPKKKKTIQQQIQELHELSNQKCHDATESNHVLFQTKQKIVTLLHDAHYQIHQTELDTDHNQFLAKMKEMQSRIEEKRRSVLKKMELACDTTTTDDGKRENYEYSNQMLHRVILLLREETLRLEESVVRLMHSKMTSEREDDDGEHQEEVSLTELEETNSRGYALASRVRQEDDDGGVELEIYEKC